MLAKPQICTRDYIFAYGHPPRGRGSWAFYFDSSEAAWWANRDGFAASMTYTEARKLALQEAIRRGAYTVAVGT